MCASGQRDTLSCPKAVVSTKQACLLTALKGVMAGLPGQFFCFMQVGSAPRDGHISWELEFKFSTVPLLLVTSLHVDIFFYVPFPSFEPFVSRLVGEPQSQGVLKLASLRQPSP